MSTNTLQLIANLTKIIQFAEKENASLTPDAFSFTKFA
jgi:hypothetical protein